MRSMYDSVDWNAIPATAPIVAGYDDGIFAWPAMAWDDRPDAIHVHIAVSSTTNSGIVGDVESGDMTPDSAVDWVLMRRAAGVDPTIYTSFNNWDTVKNAFNARNVPWPHWWIADYTGNAVLINGSVATQYANSVMTGGNYDLSIVADYWPGVDMSLVGLDPNDAVVSELRTRASDTENQLIYGNDVGSPPIHTRIGLIADIYNQIQYSVLPAIQKIGQPTVDVTALASALINDPSFVPAIAAAVVKLAGTKLTT